MVLNLRIGILGGGFAGLYTVSFLRKSISQGIDITLFDKNNYFLYTPVLHEMATGTVNARHVVIPIRKAEDPRETHIRCEEVTLVHLKEKGVETSSGAFKFDYLVLAPGSEPNFFILSRFSPQAFDDPKHFLELAEQVSKKIKKECPGVEWKESYATLGRFDVIDIVEASDPKEIEKVAMIIRALGHSTTETLLCTPWKKFLEGLK